MDRLLLKGPGEELADDGFATPRQDVQLGLRTLDHIINMEARSREFWLMRSSHDPFLSGYETLSKNVFLDDGCL